MNIEDFDNLVKDGQLTTDSILKIRDSISEQNIAFDNMKKDLETAKARVSELQEVNGKLYLRITNNIDNNDVNNTPTIEDVIKNWGKI